MEPIRPSQRTKKIVVISALILLIALGLYVVYPFVKKQATLVVKSAQTIQNELFSTPLVGNENDKNATLTTGGVITITNKERTAAGLSVLTENKKLDAAAAAKLKDMFDKQYFEHVSPDGRGPGAVAESAGYSYIIVGENLALGNFKDDAALVAAWMASPGHRANILQTRFREIGVAVGKGNYNGKEIWMAVQEFGSPLSDCPAIDTRIKTQVDADKALTNSMNLKLEALQKEIKTMPRSTPPEQEAYNQKVHEYNDLVVAYDAALSKLKAEIDTYNAEVRAFNACIKE